VVAGHAYPPALLAQEVPEAAHARKMVLALALERARHEVSNLRVVRKLAMQAALPKPGLSTMQLILHVCKAYLRSISVSRPLEISPWRDGPCLYTQQKQQTV